MNFGEICIPVPWGHICGKSYGNPDGQRVLVVHGWTDNAGTFDLLVPLLSDSLYLVCIELPGHGLSSHFPIGIPYHQIEYVTTIRRVVRNYLKWTKFDYIGHSLGAAIGSMYASIFSTDIDHLVMIDYLKMITWTNEESRDSYGTYCREFLGLDRQRGMGLAQDFPYPLANLKELYVQVTDGNLNEREAEILLKRGARCIEPGTDKWTFRRDVAIRNPGLFRLSHETVLSTLSNIRCKMLLLKAINSNWEESKELCESTVGIYKANCKSFKYIEVFGNHFVPLSNPTAIAPHINQFLLALDSEP